MASKRKSQEEKNLRTLRDLASLPANKHCFDCNQRGPTYVNITIGSFVCTSCSGRLRGLNPPHRLKSITMTTFTPEEIEFIKNRGNKYCRYVWLGTLRPEESDPSLSPPRDEQKIQEHMSNVYEKKKWYVDPEIALKKMQHDQLHADSLSNQNTTITTTAVTPPMTASSKTKMLPHQTSAPETKPSSAPLVIQNSQSQPLSLWPPTSTAPTSQSKGSLDLLAELSLDMYGTSSAPKPATPAPLSQPQLPHSDTANGNFANFESVFNSNQLVLTSSPSLGPAAPSQSSSSSSAPPRRLYTPPVGWASFEEESSTTPSAVNGSLMPRPLSLPTFSPTNPFSPPPTSTTSGSQAWCFPVAVTANSIFPSATSTVQPPSTTITQPPSLPLISASSNVTTTTASSIPPPERYAALKDLDSLFHSPPSTTTTLPSSSAPAYVTAVAPSNPPSVVKTDAFIENFNELVITEKGLPPMMSTSPSNPFIAPSLNHQPAPLVVPPAANPWTSFPTTTTVTNPFQTRSAAAATMNPPAIVPAALNNRDMLLTTMATQNGINQFQNGSWPWGISPSSQKVADQFTASWPPPAPSTANPFIGAPSSSSNNPFL